MAKNHSKLTGSLEVDDASTRRLVNRIKSGKSIVRLQTFSEDRSVTAPLVLSTEHNTVRTYKEQLKKPFAGDISCR